MKNILILLDYYLPFASANGVCCEKVASEFRDNGYDVNIVAYAYDDKEYENINGIHVHYARKIKKKSYGIWSKLAFYAAWLFKFSKYPVTEIKEQTDEIARVASQVIDNKNIDTVVCVHLPVETLVAGVKLKEKYPHLTYVSYMLDSLSGGIAPKFLPYNFCRFRKIKWENNLLALFDGNILMESSRQHHTTYTADLEWYKKAHFLDVPALCKNSHVKDVNIKVNDEVVLGFVGTMSDGVRTPYALLKVLSGISDLNIRFVIAGKNACGDLYEYLKDQNNVMLSVLGEVPYDRAQDILRECDFFVNLGNVNPNLVPSKIFEYMSYGKPIISTFNSAEDSSLPYLHKYPVVCLIDEHDDNIKNAAGILTEFIKEHRETRVSYESIAELFYNNTPVAFRDLLLKICGEENEKT